MSVPGPASLPVHESMQTCVGEHVWPAQSVGARTCVVHTLTSHATTIAVLPLPSGAAAPSSAVTCPESHPHAGNRARHAPSAASNVAS